MRLRCQSVYTPTANDIAWMSGWSTAVLAKNGGTAPAGALKFHPTWRGVTLSKKRRGFVASGWCWYWWCTIVSVFGTSSISSSGFWATWRPSVFHISTPAARGSNGGVSLLGQVGTLLWFYYSYELHIISAWVDREARQLAPGSNEMIMSPFTIS